MGCRQADEFGFFTYQVQDSSSILDDHDDLRPEQVGLDVLNPSNTNLSARTMS
jgi:hypothetical protein